MGNTPSQNFKVVGKPVSAFYNHKKVETVVVTRSSFIYYNDRTRQLINTQPSKRNISIVVWNELTNQFITGEDDFLIRIYSAEDGSYIKTIPHDSKPMNEVEKIAHSEPIKAILPIDDRYILSGSSDGSIRLWDVENGELVSVYIPTFEVAGGFMETLVSSITSLAFDKKRDFILSGSTDGVIRKYSYSDRNLIGTLEGHGRGAILNIVITNDGFVVSSSMDSSIRIWDPSDASQVGASIYLAQALIYDPLRDILFAGSDNGNVTVFQIKKSLKEDTGKYTPVKLKTFDLRKPCILHLHYNTYSDSLTATSMESNISFLPNVTDISFEDIQKNVLSSSGKLLKKNEDHEEEEEEDDYDGDGYQFSDRVHDLDGKTIQEAIEYLSKLKLDDSQSFQDVNGEEYKTKLEKLIELGSELFALEEDDEISKVRKTKFVNELKQFENSVDEIDDDYKSCLRLLVNSKPALKALDFESLRVTLELDIAKRKQEILDRHRQELQQFQIETDKEIEKLESKLPILSKKIASEYVDAKERYNHSQLEMKHSVATCLSTAFPVVNERYHIGPLISPSASTVFKGFNTETFSIVAVKILPPGITINPTKHEGLTQVLDVCETQQSMYVVMEACHSDITQFVKTFTPDNLIPLELIKSIIQQILQTLDYLHDQSLVYRDLSPSSILISKPISGEGNNSQPQIKLTHLGIMRALLGTVDSEPPEEGMIYGAPEIFGRVVNTSSDIWSLGCVLIYLLQTREEREKPLFHGHDTNAIIESMVKVVGRPFPKDIEEMTKSCSMQQDGIDLLQFAGQLPVPFEDCIDVLRKHCSRADENTLDLLVQMLHFAPQNRISAKNALSHPYFK
eukprot:gene9126-11182_t